jgi:hypothetical protein
MPSRTRALRCEEPGWLFAVVRDGNLYADEALV